MGNSIVRIDQRNVWGLLLLTLSGAASAGGLTARVDVLQDKAAAGTGQLRYVLTNTGTESAFVLRYQTALQGIEGDLFNVSLNGKPVDYVGRLVKRPQPTANDYIEVPAGATLTAKIDLTEAYDMRQAGQYAVEVDTQLTNLVFDRDNETAKSAAVQQRLHSASTLVWVDGANVTPEVDNSWYEQLKAGSVSFVSCSNTRQSQINTALSSARGYASNSSSYLNAGTAGARYTTWFGTYNSSRYSTVRSHFTNIGDALNNRALVFNCSCTDSSYAYVYPTQPYKIYLCNAFWSAPNTGTDSRAGTIVHETSHFDVVANTDDNAYGQTAAKNLARTNPARAVANADSHEYFAENTPFQN